MRTTLDLNDGLLTQAKTRAARENRTLTSVVEEALRQLLAGAAQPKQSPEIPLIRGTGGLLPGIDPTRLEASVDDLDAADRSRKNLGKS